MADSNITETIVDLFIDNYNVEALDDDKFRHINGDQGLPNPRFNMGVKYELGGLTDSAAYSLMQKKDWMDRVDTNLRVEIEANGNESAKFQRMTMDLVKAEAAYENAYTFYTVFVDLYNALTGDMWCGGHFEEDYGRRWWAERKEEMRTPTNAYVSPTKKDISKRKEMLKQRARDAQTAAAVG